MKGRAGFRPDINGLRALSVALVLAFHLQLRGSGGGFVGVDVFFVISGYLMTQIIWGGLSRGDFSYWRYLAGRALRIWPALAVMVVLLLAVGTLVLPPSDLKIVAEQALPALGLVSNHFFLARTGYNTQTVDTNWLLHTWSLSVEWQFYLLYPLVLLGAARLKAGRWLALAVVTVLWVLSLGCQVLLSASSPASAFFLLPARAWEMLAGALVFLIEPQVRLTRLPLRAVISYGGLALLLGAALWLGVRHVPPEGVGWPRRKQSNARQPADAQAGLVVVLDLSLALAARRRSAHHRCLHRPPDPGRSRGRLHVGAVGRAVAPLR